MQENKKTNDIPVFLTPGVKKPYLKISNPEGVFQQNCYLKKELVVLILFH